MGQRCWQLPSASGTICLELPISAEHFLEGSRIMGVTQPGTCSRFRAALPLSREAKHRMITTGQTGAAASCPYNPAQGQTAKALISPALAAINGCAYVPWGTSTYVLLCIVYIYRPPPLRLVPFAHTGCLSTPFPAPPSGHQKIICPIRCGISSIHRQRLRSDHATPP